MWMTDWGKYPGTPSCKPGTHSCSEKANSGWLFGSRREFQVKSVSSKASLARIGGTRKRPVEQYTNIHDRDGEHYHCEHPITHRDRLMIFLHNCLRLIKCSVSKCTVRDLRRQLIFTRAAILKSLSRICSTVACARSVPRSTSVRRTESKEVRKCAEPQP